MIYTKNPLRMKHCWMTCAGGVDGMLSMGLPVTITVIMNNSRTCNYHTHPYTSICFLIPCLISAREKYDIT